jgi:xylulokinase
MARFFLGVDVGTQGTKAVLYDTEAQRIVSSATKAYDLLATDVPGRAEQKPSTWIEVRIDTRTRHTCFFGMLVTATTAFKCIFPTSFTLFPVTALQGLREAVVAALAGTDGSKVGGIAVSGQQHGMVLLDETGSVVRDAKLWCDVEAAAEAAYISESSGFCYVRRDPTRFTTATHVQPHNSVTATSRH